MNELPPGHGLNTKAAYGPVCSRRYGRTLGVNPMPGDAKVCSFNCAYCQLGWTPAQHPTESVFADAGHIVDEVERVLGYTEGSLDALVICGNGEPTLHPAFEDLVEGLLLVRNRVRAGLRILCLTNGSELIRPEVARALSKLDEVSFKLDAGDQVTFERVDRPMAPGLRLDDLIDRMAAQPCRTVQSCFYDGELGNTAEREVEAWLRAVKRVAPTRVDLYTVSRPPASPLVQRTSLEWLRALGERVEGELGIPTRSSA